MNIIDQQSQPPATEQCQDWSEIDSIHRQCVHEHPAAAQCQDSCGEMEYVDRQWLYAPAPASRSQNCDGWDSWGDVSDSVKQETNDVADFINNQVSWGCAPPASQCRYFASWDTGDDTSAGETLQASDDSLLIDGAHAVSGWNAASIRDWEQENLRCNAEISGKPSNACAGLMNLGNTCFLNSILQCLTYTVPFANVVKSAGSKASCQVEGFCAMCAVEDHMKEIGHSFMIQQDAHEYFCFLIKALQECCSHYGHAKPPFTSMDNSFVSNMFVGRLRSQVKCNSCLQGSSLAEAFLGLSLEIENCNSVLEALSRFTAVEILEDKVICTHCKKLESRSKQLTFDKPPHVLVIHFKRFQASTILPTKIERRIKYNLSLDLGPFVSNRDSNEQILEGDLKYSLYGVLVHSGSSTASGHYFCFLHTSPGTWHYMNDAWVLEVSEMTVLVQEAYILFYIREGMDVLSGLESEDLKSFAEASPKSLNRLHMEPAICDANQASTDCGADLTCKPVTRNISAQVEVEDLTKVSRTKIDSNGSFETPTDNTRNHCQPN